MIVADASAVIAHLERGDAHHYVAKERLSELADRSLGSSTITLAEVLVGPARAGRLEEARIALGVLKVRELPLGAGAAGDLAALRADTGLKLPDCCVLLAARDASAAGLITFDEQLACTARALGLRVHGSSG